MKKLFVMFLMATMVIQGKAEKVTFTISDGIDNAL